MKVLARSLKLITNLKRIDKVMFTCLSVHSYISSTTLTDLDQIPVHGINIKSCRVNLILTNTSPVGL